MNCWRIFGQLGAGGLDTKFSMARPSYKPHAGLEVVRRKIPQIRSNIHFPMFSILIESWRFLPHSYAMVNQFQCLEMLRRPSLKLYHRDVPMFRPQWQEMRGIFDAESEKALESLHSPVHEIPDCTLRIAYPYDFSDAPTRKTAVFATSEFQIVVPQLLAGDIELTEALNKSNAVIITPSNWSRQGFLASGADPKRVVVVPHGIDPQIFRPLAEDQRRESRRLQNIDEEFVFLHVGAMTGLKNIPLLLRAFAEVCRRHSNVRLRLKGLDPLYPSGNWLAEACKALPQHDLELIQPRVNYFGGAISLSDMAHLYQLADAYVAPYFAEGFNLPVLEAAACGIPVICTAGGPTDDFVRDDFALKIESTPEPYPLHGRMGRGLAANLDSLIAHMLRVIEDDSFRTRCRTAGPTFLAENFSWKRVVDRLLQVLQI
jgi:glycosyltransferase involved in cell wall biosynthesis